MNDKKFHNRRYNHNVYSKIYYKKSQMEAFGLAVIVVLITIGFFIFISLRNQNPNPDIKKDYIVDQTSTNFINSIVNVNVEECYDNGYTISDLLKDCAIKEQIKCEEYTDACKLVNDTITTIFNRTLIKENYRFRFYTEGLNINDSHIEINISRGPCGDEEAKGMVGTLPISLYPVPRDIFINLGICTGG